MILSWTKEQTSLPTFSTLLVLELEMMKIG